MPHHVSVENSLLFFCNRCDVHCANLCDDHHLLTDCLETLGQRVARRKKRSEYHCST
ncbi:hypothetical protein B4U80_07409 [Leptotrombidium deliense]|uniref:Uncharacterized protein n=1 Tax=Leptotrombidium deliense TaxID=299467 RepID=A0A443S6W5_9ACAR|nr:hypothetical protein B4U80_07409 [Leptotrombidium deliense]